MKYSLWPTWVIHALNHMPDYESDMFVLMDLESYHLILKRTTWIGTIQVLTPSCNFKHGHFFTVRDTIKRLEEPCLINLG